MRWAQKWCVVVECGEVESRSVPGGWFRLGQELSVGVFGFLIVDEFPDIHPVLEAALLTRIERLQYQAYRGGRMCGRNGLHKRWHNSPPASDPGIGPVSRD